MGFMKKLKQVVGTLTNVQKVALIVASALVPVEAYIAVAIQNPALKAFALAEVAVVIALLGVLFGVSPVPPTK